MDARPSLEECRDLGDGVGAGRSRHESVPSVCPLGGGAPTIFPFCFGTPLKRPTSGNRYRQVVRGTILERAILFAVLVWMRAHAVIIVFCIRDSVCRSYYAAYTPCSANLASARSRPPTACPAGLQDRKSTRLNSSHLG